MLILARLSSKCSVNFNQNIHVSIHYCNAAHWDKQNNLIKSISQTSNEQKHDGNMASLFLVY